jgi:error-prone DNA polymerase
VPQAAGDLPGPARPYRSLADFVARTGVSREIAENLVRVGAFDALSVRREELLPQVPLLYAGTRPTGRRRGAGASAAATASLAAGPSGLDQPRLVLDEQLGALDFLPSWTLEQRVRAELEVLGLNVSAHPLRFVHDQIEALGVTPFARLAQVRHGRRVRLAGVLERAQMPWIRSGHRTMFLTLEDETELAQVVVFNDVYLKYGRVLKSAIYLYVEGELQNDEEHGLAVVAHRIADLLAVVGKAGGRPSTPSDGKPPKRADAWELPEVQPQTRPGRTG